MALSDTQPTPNPVNLQATPKSTKIIVARAVAQAPLGWAAAAMNPRGWREKDCVGVLLDERNQLKSAYPPRMSPRTQMLIFLIFPGVFQKSMISIRYKDSA